jgi:hypothetical protein
LRVDVDRDAMINDALGNMRCVPLEVRRNVRYDTAESTRSGQALIFKL